MEHIVVAEKNHEAAFALPARCDISSISWCHEHLVNYANNNDSMMLNAAGVEKITSPAIQLLISLHKKMERENAQLLVAEPSSAFTGAFRDFGLMDLLQKWSKEV